MVGFSPHFECSDCLAQSPLPPHPLTVTPHCDCLYPCQVFVCMETCEQSGSLDQTRTGSPGLPDCGPSRGKPSYRRSAQPPPTGPDSAVETRSPHRPSFPRPGLWNTNKGIPVHGAPSTAPSRRAPRPLSASQEGLPKKRETQRSCPAGMCFVRSKRPLIDLHTD